MCAQDSLASQRLCSGPAEPIGEGGRPVEGKQVVVGPTWPEPWAVTMGL